MPAIPYRKTATSTGPWDGPKEEAALDGNLSAAALAQSYAWRRDGVDPTTKAAYALVHHETVGGKAGPANMAGCRAALQRLGQVKPAIPADEVSATRAHMVKHLSDGQASAHSILNDAIRKAAGHGD